MVTNIRKKALNKSIVFPLDRKQVSTSSNEEFDEKYVSTIWNAKKIGGNSFHKPER